MNIVIVGGSFAGIHAAIYLRQLMPTSEIYLIEKQSKLGWIPQRVQFDIKKERLPVKTTFLDHERKNLTDRYRIHVYTEKTVIRLKRKKVVLAGGKKIGFLIVLILATGSNQKFRNISAESTLIHPVKKDTKRNGSSAKRS